MSDDFCFREQMTFNVKWLGFSQVLHIVLQFVVWAVLARLLPADNFGALGIALAFTNLVYVFRGTGDEHGHCPEEGFDT